MVSVLAIFGGILFALGIHAFVGWLRSHYPLVAGIGGLLLALGLTGVGVAYLGPYTGEVHGAVIVGLIVFWGLTLVLGSLKAWGYSLSWWLATTSVSMELVLVLLSHMAVWKLIELGFYHGFEDDPKWIVARMAGNAFMVSLFLATLSLTAIRAVWHRNGKVGEK